MPRSIIAPAVLCAVVLAACTKPDPAPEPVRSVRTMTVASGSAGGLLEYAAEVRARTESRLAFRVGGTMVKRLVDAGQRVKAGDVLARLDVQDLQLAQAAALASEQAARVNAELAEADHRRFADLYRQNFISAAELERREATLKAARAQLDQARAQAAVQGNQADYATLRAPVAGVVTAVEAEPGAVLAAGSPVLRLAHDGSRDAVFAVPEDALERIRLLAGRPGALRVRPWAGATIWPATVHEIAAAADPATRTFQVKADLGSAPVQLGQTVTVLLDLPRSEGITRLPLTAVTHQQGKTAVWLVEPSTMTVRLQPIEVAGADGNTVVAAAGLTPGQLVVTAGVHVLAPGQKVKLFDSPPAASAASR